MNSLSIAERKSLIEQHIALVKSLAWRIHRKLPPQIDLDDLIGYGQVGLAEAARDFDPGREIRFSTFAFYRIRGAILDGLSKMSWFRSADFDRGKYEHMSEEEFRETPEGARLAGQSPEDISLAKRQRMQARFISGADRFDEEFFLQSVEDPKMWLPSEEAERKEAFQRLESLMGQLPFEEANFLRNIYFNGMSLTEASEAKGISKAWGSRLHAKLLAGLAHSMSETGHN